MVELPIPDLLTSRRLLLSFLFYPLLFFGRATFGFEPLVGEVAAERESDMTETVIRYIESRYRELADGVSGMARRSQLRS